VGVNSQGPYLEVGISREVTDEQVGRFFGAIQCVGMKIGLSIYRLFNAPRRDPPPRNPLSEVGQRIGGSACFPEGTLVQTEDGVQPIQDLQAGAILWVGTPSDQVTVFASVGRVRRSLAREFVVLAVAGEVIRCTQEHPFWVRGRGWVPAAQLKADDCLVDASGGAHRIQSISLERSRKPERVYNLTVTGPQAYHVGEVGVLVHNKTEW